MAKESLMSKTTSTVLACTRVERWCKSHNVSVDVSYIFEINSRFCSQFRLVSDLKNYLQMSLLICDVLRDLVPFAQLRKREKHPWRSATFSNASNFTKSNTPPWVFFTFLKLTNDTKSRNALHIKSIVKHFLFLIFGDYSQVKITKKKYYSNTRHLKMPSKSPIESVVKLRIEPGVR